MTNDAKTNETAGSKAPSHVAYHVRDPKAAKASGPASVRYGRIRTAKASTSSSTGSFLSTAASRSAWLRKRRSNSPNGAGLRLHPIVSWQRSVGRPDVRLFPTRRALAFGARPRPSHSKLTAPRYSHLAPHLLQLHADGIARSRPSY
jgi:hypothetical protein